MRSGITVYAMAYRWLYENSIRSEIVFILALVIPTPM